MIIRFLKPWNGYQPDQVVSGLTNEAALIAGGLASADLDGGNDGRIYDAKFATDASGNVTGLVGPTVSWKLRPAASGVLNFGIIGDSMTASAASNVTITAATRSNGVVTATATGHAAGDGEICSIVNMADATFESAYVAITKVDANTISYTSPGVDGSTANASATKTMSLLRHAIQNDNNYMPWLISRSGGAARLAYNSGRVGDSADGMRTRYLHDMAQNDDVDVVIIQTGYNDFVAGSRTADQVYDDVTAMIKMSPNKMVIVVSALPWTTGGADANRKEAVRYNRKIRDFCNQWPNVRFADAAKKMVDALGATKFTPLSGMLLADGIHPSPKGAKLIAEALYEAVGDFLPTVSRLPSSNADCYGFDASSKNILTQGPWTASGGATSGGASGTVGADCAVTLTNTSTTATAVCSTVARSDGTGYDQNVVFTPGGNGDAITYSSTGYLTGRAAVGDILQMLGELALSGVSGSNIKSIEAYITFNGASAYAYALKTQSTGVSTYFTGDATLFISGPEAVVPIGTTGIGWTIKITAGAAGTALTSKLGPISVEKLVR